jgi:hypothetical protein
MSKQARSSGSFVAIPSLSGQQKRTKLCQLLFVKRSSESMNASLVHQGLLMSDHRTSVRFDRHLQIAYQKCPLIGDFFDDLGCRFSGSVSGSCFNSNEHRVASRVALLQHGREFETVSGDNSIVGISRRHHCCRITDAVIQVLKW